ncbi:hypothetical protein SERLA73DRAFT_72407 [Serpula lacrymans var. lacrymans S7.3]|uniref:FAD-binding domain-containing protein n=2 Tax=Serpula lacrymans var. lacrymans TaxID=341189 RepID=F8PTX8_SERL3|nr:uncharacterized protein SERLADRAFT_436930 [Serpula lacrymans var. lacrymans S7.9]EGN99603.1 hypothetical protein SERLA73DRAFT_72407 [Serpula lacrymans var. lacrymans S7.3]EGO25171.1 hypothetical protein SERLADRAFT_436930 [Serpula lacrymans var. lacrymans S7.9]
MSNIPTSTPVLIAGAGPAGLVAALTLLRNGISVRIIEKEAKYRVGQRGPGIFPRALELFHHLEVPEIAQTAKLAPQMRTYKLGGVELLKTFPMSPYTEPTPAIPYYNLVVIGQETLEGILRSHVEKLSCTVELGTELCSFEQFSDHVVAHVTKEKHGEVVHETIRANWLVGADGAKGIVRKHLGLTFLGETREDMRIVTGDIYLAAKGVDREHRHVFGEMGTRAVILRPTDEFGPDGYQFIMAGPDLDTTLLAGNKDELFKCMSAIVGTDITFGELRWVSEFRPNIRMVNTFGEGRVFVAGDAAHVHSPTGGQGLNSSIQDSFNLGWKIALVEKGFAPISLMDTYTAERLPVIAEMLNITTTILDKTTAATRSTAESAFQRGQKMYMLGVNYRNSPIVVDEFVTEFKPADAYGNIQDGCLQAGDRAPDAPGLMAIDHAATVTSGTTRLFTIFRPWYHTLLIFVPDVEKSTSFISALERYQPGLVRSIIIVPSVTSLQPNPSADNLLVDRDGHAYKGYLVNEGETKVVAVRPDGVVGAIVRGAEGMVKYFGGVFGV